MTITIKPASKNDFKHFVNMNKQFRSEYDGTLMKNEVSAKKAFMDAIHNHYFIMLNDRHIGYFTMYLTTNQTEKFNCFWDMFVLPEYRHLGYAGQARKIAIKKHNAKCVFVAYGRIKKQLAYWQGLGFTHINWDLQEQGADEKCCANLTIGALCNVSLPLTLENVINTQDTAKNYWDTIGVLA